MRRPSTTWRQTGARMSQPPAGQGNSAHKAGTVGRKPRSAHRQPVTVTLQFLPGAEPWIRISYGELTVIRPGGMPVWQLVLWLNGWYQGGQTGRPQG